MKSILLALLIASTALTAETIQLEHEPLSYTATVGSLPLFDAEQNELGQISYISYVKEPTLNRPITFAFNGGPGSSSIWLHMGTFGPRRIKSPEEGQSLVPPYEIVDNLETILDLTDLVFIDPIGTGLSSKISEKTRPFFDVVKDYQSVGQFIRDYIGANQRWNSPKYIAGESYGALRACGLAAYLHTDLGIYLNGMLLISPAIDYQAFIFNSDNKFPYLLYFPTYATTAWFHGRGNQDLTVEQVAANAKKFVYENYAPKLLCKSCYSQQQKEELYNQISEFIGLPAALVQKKQGKISEGTFFLEFFGDDQRTLGRMDTRSVGYYSRSNRVSFLEDPSVTSIDGSFVAAFHNYLDQELHTPQNYQVLSLEINSTWNFTSYNDWGYPNLMPGLRQALVTNPKMNVYVGCGYYDCATPFAAAEYCIDHLDLPELFNDNIQLDHYSGGHMYYLNPTARLKFKQDLIRFYKK